MLDDNETIFCGLGTETSMESSEILELERPNKRPYNEERSQREISHGLVRLNFIKKELIYTNLSRNTEDLNDLVVHFKKRLENKPFDVNLTMSLGSALEQLGEISRAKRLYARFSNKKQSAGRIYVRLAEIFFKEKNYQKAKVYYSKSLETKSQLPRGSIYLKLAYCCHNLKEFDLGSEFAKLALKETIPASLPEIHLLIGNLYLKAKNYRQAIRQYLKGLKNSTNYTTAIKKILHSTNSINKISLESFREAVKVTSPKLLEAKLLNNTGNALNKLGKYELAKKILERALSLEVLPYAYNNLAMTLKAQGNLEDSLVNLSKAERLLPNSALISYNLAETYLSKGVESKAVKYFKKTLEQDKRNKSAQHKLNALLGKTTPSAPAIYISNLFDKYASTFDHHLSSSLDYRVPEEIRKCINTQYGEYSTFDRVLDLGCGTGLCGVTLRGRCSELIGVDLSEQMLGKAKKKGVYTQLEKIELTKYLKNSKLKFDLIIAGDVLIYVGKLDKLFHYCNQAIKAKARFIFSVEEAKTGNFKINKTGRFSHNREYIRKAAAKHGWYVETENKINVRKENHYMIKGFIFSLTKN